MDQFIREALEGDFLWSEFSPMPPVLNPSAFEPYIEAPGLGKPANSGDNGMNVNKRMVQFLRKSYPPLKGKIRKSDIEEKEHGKEKGFCHMINERMRREKQRQSYFALHALLPNRTRTDKNWIVQVATTNIQQLERDKEELRKRNMELESSLGKERSVNWSRIRLRVANPTSGVDSMVELLKCLKSLGLKTRNIQSSFSHYEFSAEVEMKIEAAEAAVVEAAMQETLYEVERKLLSSFPGR